MEDLWAALEEGSVDPKGLGSGLCQSPYAAGSYEARNSFLLLERSTSIDIDGTSPWIKINVDQTCFYRVKYDESLAYNLRSAIEGQLLSPTDRFEILDDSFALCKA
ncbi:hypothetical protein SAY86_004704 [Trapa natans]|uniref:ERAP1-like C-terminal domain-containing protein n=1 Tax=Trapa natans TaxID=22666 RepID=A0AAN7RI63_TRANT|nr:hypothetical protein SAY86_004704 [Trapa natans]